MKEITIDEYKKQINRITEYIANHLDEEINLNTLAEFSCFSPYHFHRITRAFLKEPIGCYIQRIRIETAARLLRYSNLPISEVAYRVGYDAPNSLTKSFKQLYGITPAGYRNNKDFTIMKPIQINNQLNIKGPKTIDIPTKQMIYIKLSGEYSKLDFPGTWGKLWAYIKEEKLYTAGIEHLAIYHDDPKVTESEKLRTDLCLVVTKDAIPKGEIGVKDMPGGRFALFVYTGPYDKLDAAYDTIYAQLLPEAGLQLRDAPCFDKYKNHPGRTAPEKLKTEIYIPVE